MRWAAGGVAAGLLVLAACGGGAPSEALPGARNLPCRETIGSRPPARGMSVVLGVVALPASPGMPRALQTASTGGSDPAARLFAKWGLVIRPGARLRLIVPDRLRRSLSIAWGNSAGDRRGSSVVIDRCRGPRGARWLAYAGGYFVRDPMCASLIVAAHGQRRRVRIGVGRACPGQRPPPQPSER